MSRILPALGILLPYSITAIMLSFTSPVYPLLAHQRNVSPFIQGLFFAIYSLPYLFVFFYLPASQRKCGAKNTFFAHMLLCTIATFLMSSLHFIHEVKLFSALSIFLQFFNGIGGGAISNQYFTLAKRLFPSHFEFMNELPNSLFIFCYGVAPLIAAQSTARLGFHVNCYIIGTISLLITLLSLCLLPAQACEPVQSRISLPQEEHGQEQRSELTYKELLKKPRVMSSLAVLFMGYFMITYYVPFFALELHYNFNIAKSNLGYFYLVQAVGGIVTGTPIIQILRRCLRLSTIIVIGIVIGLAGNSLTGFCPLFKIPHQISFIWAGVFFNGSSFSFINAPIIPLITNYYEQNPSELEGIQDMTHEEQVEAITEKVVAICTFTVGLSMLIAPLLGRALYEWLGYQGAFGVVSGLLLVIGVIFLVFGGVFSKEQVIQYSTRYTLYREEEDEEGLVKRKQEK